MLESHVVLRRCRKAILRDLSSYVKAAKHLQELIQQGEEHFTALEQLDDIVRKAFKVVNRAVKLHDLSTYLLESASEVRILENRLPTPPAETQQRLLSSSNAVTLPCEGSLTDRDSVIPGSEKNILSVSPNSSTKGRVQSALTPSTKSSLQRPQFPYRPHSFQVQDTQVRYRWSLNTKINGQQKTPLVSEQLFQAHDTFLGCIGAFIGLHLHSRSSSELHLNTERSVKACHTLLAIIDGLWERDQRRSDDLWKSRDALRCKVADLVYATKEVFSKDPVDGEQQLIIDEGKHIVSAATNCVRSAADCIAKAKFIIERIGDYELSNVLETATTSKDEVHTPIPVNQFSQGSKISRASLLPGEDNEVLNFSRTNIKVKTLYQTPQSHPVSKRASATSETRYQVASASALAGSNILTTSSDPSSSYDFSPLIDNDSSPTTVSVDNSHVKPLPQPAVFSSRRASSTQDNATDSTTSSAGSLHEVGASENSDTSTRATSSDSKYTSSKQTDEQKLNFSFSSGSDFQSLQTDNTSELEDQLLGKSYIHELVFSKDGSVAGGTLPAFVEQLTTHDSTPDSTFVNAFYLTFRLFTTPTDLTKALIDRYVYVGDYPTLATPVRLRVYNIMKGWLESHWNGEVDSVVLDIIRDFANNSLRSMWPSAASRLVELTSKVANDSSSPLVQRCPTAMGKHGAEVGTLASPNDSHLPAPIVSKAQLNTLRNFRTSGAPCNILAFDPLELARQFTIIESRIFCSIQPEELLALEWTKKTSTKAVNIKAMSTLSTDLANLVADTILQPTEAKRRATVIKQWVKIAMKCLDLNNYDSLMAIICSLNSSMILRLKKTWDVLSTKTKNRLEELCSIVDVGRNYAVLRQRLQNQVAPCIPFVGIYLTDLTFVDVGNQTTRQLRCNSTASEASPSCSNSPNSPTTAVQEVINFDKHMRTAKIIGQLQRFQIPHRLAPVPEMQDWMEYQILRVRNSDQANVQGYYRRSLLLEPREPTATASNSASVTATSTAQAQGQANGKDSASPVLGSTTGDSSFDHVRGANGVATIDSSSSAPPVSSAVAPPKDNRFELFGFHFLSKEKEKDKGAS